MPATLWSSIAVELIKHIADGVIGDTEAEPKPMSWKFGLQVKKVTGL